MLDESARIDSISLQNRRRRFLKLRDRVIEKSGRTSRKEGELRGSR